MCMIFKPQVCIVSDIHVHCCRVTHKPNEAHSEVVMYRHAHFNSRVSLTRLISHYGYASLGFEMIIEYLRWESFVTLYI